MIEALAGYQSLEAHHQEHHRAHDRNTYERHERESNAHSPESNEDRDRSHDWHATSQHQPVSATAFLLIARVFLDLKFVVRLMMRHNAPLFELATPTHCKTNRIAPRRHVRHTMIGFGIAAVS